MLKDDLIKVFNNINDKYNINGGFPDNSKSYMSLIEKINSFIDIKEDDFIILGARSGWVYITKKISELVVSFENLFILDKFYLTLQEIEDQIIINKSKKTLVIIDELQSFVSEKEYVETCKKLKTLTREYNIPIVLLSKDPWVEKRIDKKPRISDLDYQGNISNYANKIYLLHREELYNPDTAKTKILDVYIAKNDNGLSNQLIEMYFDDDLKKVSSLERNW